MGKPLGMSENETAPTVGQTGGLPGANANPAASEITDDEAADTVNIGQTAPVDDDTSGT